jgi:hypothetical protein
MKTRSTILLLLLFAVQPLRAQAPALPEIDRIRLAEAFRLAGAVGNGVWKNWDKAPFAVLLVTPEHEFLVRHPRPSADFILIGEDKLLQSRIYYRQRTQPVGLLATFPLVGGVSTIVVGQAENTWVKTSTPWVVTILHEHLHQLQDSQDGYYAEVGALDLAGGDETGMWQLNYPFPYEKPEVANLFAVLSQALAEALETADKKRFAGKLAAYLAARRQFVALLSPRDYKYLSFQLWKEGVSRYTEYRVAAAAARKYKPSREFAALRDYQSFQTLAAEHRQKVIKQLTTLTLDRAKREIFYPFGAGEAMLLDRANPGWQKRYLTEKFDLEKYFEKRGKS